LPPTPRYSPFLRPAFPRDLPFDAANRVVDLTTQHTANGRIRMAGLSVPEFREWQASARPFDGISAFCEIA
jgi:hypothetical protein